VHGQTPEPFKVRYSQVAADYINDIKKRVGRADDQGRKGTNWHTVYSGIKKCVSDIIGKNPISPDYALGKKRDVRLTGIFRGRVGRLRIFWIASSDRHESIVLFIGYRRAGDQKDAYAAFVKYLRSGKFDHHFKELGQKNPMGGC
jgi:mRNA-degrading endonuclease RelE of RelBE toxin-antitoxin system